MAFKRQESHQFNRVPQVRARRSEFDRSHGLKTTFDCGYLIPIFADEVVPGDTHRLEVSIFSRLATLLKPIMDNLYLETFFFFTPTRLLFDNWQRMWGEQDNPGDSTDFLTPIVPMPAAGAAAGSFWDYLGIPTAVPDLPVNALYGRAYNLIYNQWFRDQNLQDSVPFTRDDGPDDPADYVILRRGKRHDYFTSCVPQPQKGPDVTMPLGSTAPVIPDDTTPGVTNAPIFTGQAVTTPAIPDIYLTNAPGGASGSNAILGWPAGVFGGSQDALQWQFSGLVADLSTASAASINDFRQAVVVQQYYEMLARGGSRYTELLRSVYGVSNGDDRLQRPEYLGGGRTPLMVNPVVNTTGPAGGNAQGELAAYGVASSRGGQGHGFSKSFTEHGVILGLVCVRADLNYQQGLLRQFSRRSKFDYLIPHFASIGEQAVLNQEIYAQDPSILGPTGDPENVEVFGYVPRYDDYRYKPSMITGQYRSNHATSLDFWHLAQDFADLPTLSPDFIVEDPPVDRVVAVPSEPHLLFDSWFQLRSVRELPVYSVPGLARI